MDISILIPSIRPHLLKSVYESIEKSFHGSWELVLASPYPIPEELKQKNNIIYIKDNGTPIRGRQLCLIKSTGDYICYAADDVIFEKNSLDIAFSSLKDKDYKTLIVGKYIEGNQDNPFMKGDDYWKLYTHDGLKPIISNKMRGYYLINTGLIFRQLMIELGGFDCSFEACAISCVDLSIRLQNYGSNCILQNEPIFHSTHLPVGAGDHAPIHNAQIGHDFPLFLMMYKDERSQYRTKIEINNWESSQIWWTRRFGKQT